MLNTFRSKIKFWSHVALWPVIIAFIAFYGWSFVGDNTMRPVRSAATIGETTIDWSEVNTLRNRYQQFYRQMYKDNFEQMAKNMDFQELALNRLVDDEILAQEAVTLGIQVSDEEIRYAIKTTQAFLKNGVFSPQYYNNSLKMMGLSPAQYEHSIGREILLTKTRALIGSMTPLTQDEVKESFIRQTVKVDADFVSFKNANYLENVQTEDSEVESYYNEHKDEFKIGDQYKLDFIQIDTAEFEASTEVTEEEIDDYYSSNSDRYKQPEQVKASHILIKVDAGSSDEIWAAAQTKATDLKKRLDAGEAFEALAQEYSDDPSAKMGGDLGYFSKNQMVKPFEEAAWALEINQISQPVKSNFGYHIIKKFDYKPISYKPIEEVQESIVVAIKKEAAKDLALEKARSISKDPDKKLSEIAAENNMQVLTTELFEKNQPPREIGRGKNFEDVFNLENGAVSAPVETNRGIFLFSLNQKIDEHIPEFAIVKEKVITKVKQVKSGAVAKAKADSIHNEMVTSNNWDAVVAKHDLKPETTGEFAQGSFIPKVGNDESVCSALFALNVGDISDVKVFNDKCVIFKIKASTTFDDSKFTAEIPSLNAKLLTSRQQQTVDSWIQNRKEMLRKDQKFSIEAIEKDDL